jgi:hypothetical protein
VKLRRGIKAWSEYLIGHLGVGGRAMQGGRRRREKVATVGRRGEEDETDSLGPLDREVSPYLKSMYHYGWLQIMSRVILFMLP